MKSRILEEPGRPPLVVQWSNAAADEIRPNHLQGEPDNGEAMDSGGGDCELPILGVDIAPIVSADRLRLANLEKFLWVLLLNLAPLALPLLPPLLLSAVLGCTPVKPLQRWVKRAMHATTFGVKFGRWKP